MNKIFTVRDARETIIGSFVATIFFFVIRAGNPFNISLTISIIITIAVIWLSNPNPNSTNGFGRYLKVIAITYVTISLLAIGFKLATFNIVSFGLLNGGFNLDVLTSAVIVGLWIGLPVAVIFEKEGQDSYLARIFTRKKR